MNMMMKNKFFRNIIIIVILAAVGMAPMFSTILQVKAGSPIPFVPEEHEYTPGRYGGTYRSADLEMASTMIPNIPGGFDQTGASMVYPVLVCLDYGVMEGIPPYGDLAEWWEVSEDSTTITFYLTSEAKWWDGEPVTAHDVKYTYDYIIDKKYGAYGYILNEVDKIEVLNDYALRIILKEPNAAFVQMLSMVSNWSAWIMPKHIYEGEEWEGNPRGLVAHPDMEDPEGKINPDGIIGAGPFIITEFEPGEYIVGVRYDYYHHGRPYVDKVIVEVVPDSVVGLTAFKAGKYDFLTNSYAPSFAEIESINNTEGITVALRGWVYDLSIIPNIQREPFDDIRVRQALSMAIDRESISRIAFSGYYPPDYWACIPFMERYQNKDATFPRYDKDAAEALLDEAGLPRDADGWRFKTTMINGPYPDDEIVSEAVVQYLREVGIDVEWLHYDGATWASKRNSGDFDMTAYWVNYAPDPHYNYRFFHTDGGSNYNEYSNPEVDALIEAGKLNPVWEERLAIYYEVQEILVQDIPWIPVVNEMYFFFKQDNWHGLPGDTPPDGGMGRMMTWMGGTQNVWNDEGSLEAPEVHTPWEVETVIEYVDRIEYVDVEKPTGITWTVLGAAVVASLVIAFAAGYFITKQK